MKSFKNKPMKRCVPGLVGLFVMTLFGACSSGGDESDAQDFDPLVFAEPLVEHHPYVRWWWPGGAVDAVEIETEIETLARIGFGGVEVQAFTYGMVADDLGQPGVKTWGTAAFFDAITAADEAASAHDIALDLNLESNDDVTQRLRVNLTAKRFHVFDPEQAEPVEEMTLDRATDLEIALPARRWRILVFDR